MHVDVSNIMDNGGVPVDSTRPSVPCTRLEVNSCRLCWRPPYRLFAYIASRSMHACINCMHQLLASRRDFQALAVPLNNLTETTGTSVIVLPCARRWPVATVACQQHSRSSHLRQSSSERGDRPCWWNSGLYSAAGPPPLTYHHHCSRVRPSPTASSAPPRPPPALYSLTWLPRGTSSTCLR